MATINPYANPNTSAPIGRAGGGGGIPAIDRYPVDGYTGETLFNVNDTDLLRNRIGSIYTISDPFDHTASLQRPPEYGAIDLGTKPGAYGRVMRWIGRELLGEENLGQPTTYVGKTVYGIRSEQAGGGSVVKVFGEEYDREADRLYGFDTGDVFAGLKKWVPIVVVLWLAATLLGPAIGRSVGSGLKGAIA